MADCIILFGLHRLDVFPIDVWVRRVMKELYFQDELEEKISLKDVQKLAKEKFLNIPGIAQQYLYYWKRNTSL